MRMIELESNVQDFRGSSEHASPGPGVRLAFSAMACPCQIVTDEDDAAHARIVAGRMRDEVLRIEAKYSRYRDDSIVSRINAAAGTATAEIGRAHVCTPVNNAHTGCRLLLETKNNK